ncbi:ganglioside GM2 activator-like isoform X1 [Littorina saxatilis]|uniref:MD-2-related lipid-recognition domain-containing protein n=1 Tax=Littorina saxatilis TaxID=31220 RepID=A0AAN9BXM6_9CAEN
MPRVCVFVSFLLLLVSVQSRHFMKFSYEELTEDVAKDSVPMAVLVKPLNDNVLRFKQAWRLGSFSWSDCGKPSKIMSLTNLVVSPDPIEEGATAQVTVEGVMDETVSSPIEADVKLEYNTRIFGWKTVPCTQGVGSCDYPNICSKLPSGTCPIKKGKYHMTKSFPVPTSPPSGDYRVTVNLKSQGTWLACFHINAAISN